MNSCNIQEYEQGKGCSYMDIGLYEIRLLYAQLETAKLEKEVMESELKSHELLLEMVETKRKRAQLEIMELESKYEKTQSELERLNLEESKIPKFIKHIYNYFEKKKLQKEKMG